MVVLLWVSRLGKAQPCSLAQSFFPPCNVAIRASPTAWTFNPRRTTSTPPASKHPAQAGSSTEALDQLRASPLQRIAMSSTQPRSGERMVHQDFIARIRFSNALPPPPNPPKLLDIPNTGLASGQYTNPGFASRLAREQPLNIEADAELGMPLDLVGMPGVFDGDERCEFPS